ncbi:MAG: excisionase family DNA-binding protein [Syntrophorhabdales bacterium]|jgi:excisionase family DNA binding protein
MDELWDVGKLSQYLGIKKSTLYALVERKEIPFYRIGRLARFKLSEINEWLLTKKQGKQEVPIARAHRKRESLSSSAAQIVRAAIDEVNPGRYNRRGKSDRIKGLGKEG